MKQKFKNILIIRLRAVGDMILATPVIQTLREGYPTSKISILVEPMVADIVLGNSILDEVIIFDREGLKELPWYQSLWQQIRFIQSLRRKKFDLVIDLFSGTRSALHSALSGARCRVGYDLPILKYLYNIIVKPERKVMHTVEHQLEMVRHLGLKVTNKDLFIPIFQSDREWVNTVLEEYCIISGQVLVVVNPGAGSPLKIWKSERFARLVDELVIRHGIRVIITGNSNDRSVIDEISTLMKTKPINLVGQTKLKQLAALIEKADLFIGSDSGPMHLASAMGTPVVAIFGPSDYRRWRPWGVEHTIVRKDISCSPCRYRECKRGHECLESLTFEQVWAAVERHLLKLGKLKLGN